MAREGIFSVKNTLLPNAFQPLTKLLASGFVHGMKAKLFPLFAILLLVGCGDQSSDAPPIETELEKATGGDGNETLDKIISKAVLESELHRGVDQEGEELLYSPDKETPYNGWTKYVYENGQVEFLTQFQDGKVHGSLMTWYENGVQESEEKYKKGKPHGLHKDWHENGQKAETSNYKEGKRHGFHAECYDNGEKFIEKNYNEGLKHGVYLTWYANGHKKSEGNYEEDKKKGLWIEYNEDGTEYRRLTYKDGKETIVSP